MNPGDLISRETRYFELEHGFELEGGDRLDTVRIAYRTWGTLARSADNCVVVCHALTGSADVESWWPRMLGPGLAFDPTRDYVVCANILGSCYGSTGPLSSNPNTGTRWGPDFPPLHVRDLVRAQMLLLDELGVEKIKLVTGGSLGGMQTLEWALLDQRRVQAIAPIATSGRHSAWCIAISEAQRVAIRGDRRWHGGWYPAGDGPREGLAAARMMAMCSYRSPASFAQRFAREVRDDGVFQAESYLHHQGNKLVERFDANSYICLTTAMDRHDVTRPPRSYEETLASITQPALVVAIDSDLLYLPAEQQELVEHLPNAELAWLRSENGHDTFLIDTQALTELLLRFRAKL